MCLAYVFVFPKIQQLFYTHLNDVPCNYSAILSYRLRGIAPSSDFNIHMFYNNKTELVENVRLFEKNHSHLLIDFNHFHDLKRLIA